MWDGIKNPVQHKALIIQKERRTYGAHNIWMIIMLQSLCPDGTIPFLDNISAHRIRFLSNFLGLIA